jgi:putative transposase
VSSPRIIDPGATLAITRRTTRRYFLLNPDESRQIEQAYWYCLAYAAQAHGVIVHAACLMSNHSHEVITDVRGELSLFLQTFHRYFALVTKAHRGWAGEVFDKEQSSVHTLLTPEAMLASIAYLIANPVAAGAVRYAKDWPSAQTLPRDVGTRTIRAKRPDLFFDPKNPMWPELVELPLQIPAAVELEYGTDLAQQRIAERVREREHRAWAESRRTGVPFMGSRRVLKLPHTKQAESHEASRGFTPRFASGGDRRAARQATKRIRAFNAQYRDALRAWREGDREAIFPEGTWWMCVFHGARCGPAP